MPPGKHKSKLKTAHQSDQILIPLFLSRQGSRVDQNYCPPIISRQQSFVQSDFQYVIRNIDVSLIRDGLNIEFGAIDCKFTEEDNQLWVYDLIRTLKLKQQDFENCTIQILNHEETQQLVNHPYFTPNLQVFQNLGTDPINQNCYVKIPVDQTKIQLKVRSSKSSLLDCILDDEKEEVQNKNQKTKQRSLSQVVEKVALWRRLYTGFYDQNKTFIQMSLDKAAEKVGISKKTLDDYLLQIRYGKRYGFDFRKYSQDGISKLRQFVKSKKEKKNDT